MPRLVLEPDRLDSSGVAVAPAAVNADGYAIYNNRDIILLLENNVAASAGATVTIITPAERDGLALADNTKTIAGNGRLLIGPFDQDIYNQPNDPNRGAIHINFTGAVADLVMQSFRVH